MSNPIHVGAGLWFERLASAAVRVTKRDGTDPNATILYTQDIALEDYIGLLASLSVLGSTNVRQRVAAGYHIMAGQTAADLAAAAPSYAQLVVAIEALGTGNPDPPVGMTRREALAVQEVVTTGLSLVCDITDYGAGGGWTALVQIPGPSGPSVQPLRSVAQYRNWLQNYLASM